MAVGCLRLGMRFLARKEGSWLRLCPQQVAPPLASPSAAGLLVNAEESLWVEAVEPTLRPVLEAQRNFVVGEELQVLVAEPGDMFGQWISAEIASDGDWPSMYHIRVKEPASGNCIRRENVPMWTSKKKGSDATGQQIDFGVLIHDKSDTEFVRNEWNSLALQLGSASFHVLIPDLHSAPEVLRPGKLTGETLREVFSRTLCSRNRMIPARYHSVIRPKAIVMGSSWGADMAAEVAALDDVVAVAMVSPLI
ncbi:unnamed protein product, partial [Symbiodinium sp. CCMP2456]